MRLTSPSFADHQEIPEKFSCKGKNVNPPLQVEHVPSGAESLALIVDDPDAPMGTFVHWVVYNIPPGTRSISEDSIPGTQGANSQGRNSYGGPCPPSGTHRYFFKLYALDTRLPLDQEAADKQSLEEGMRGHVLGAAQLVGTFSRR